MEGSDEGREPSPAFLEELGAAFRRLRPQGDHRWNFGGAFRQLETVVRRGVRLAESQASGDAAADQADAGGDRRPPARVQLDRALTRVLTARMGPAARQAVVETVGPALDGVNDGLGASLEAFRFLSARIQALEDAAARRRSPIDGMAWLLPPPDLSGWVEPVADWLRGTGGEVIVGECGDGTLPAALAAAGLQVRAAEPRGTVAWAAGARGVDVHLGPVAELLSSRPSASVGGLVLAGVVDRSPVEDLVELVMTAADRLVPDAPFVVIGTSPATWAPAALDLLPGRPLHAATWSLLLARHGYRDIETTTADPPVAYAMRALR